MPKYNTDNFDPPAPAAHVRLRNPIDSMIFVDNVIMLLDTGADVTLLPQPIIKELGLSPIPEDYYELMGFNGTRNLASSVELEMILLNKVFKGKFLLIDQSIGIIGRDVLNHLSLSYDGPKLTWSQSPS